MDMFCNSGVIIQVQQQYWHDLSIIFPRLYLPDLEVSVLQLSIIRGKRPHLKFAVSRFIVIGFEKGVGILNLTVLRG